MTKTTPSYHLKVKSLPRKQVTINTPSTSETMTTNGPNTTAPRWIASNNLLSLAAEGQACSAFGIKIVNGGEIVQIAKPCGYDSLFIDLEHTTLKIRDAVQLCLTGNAVGIAPFARVPHECGIEFMQKVLNGGAMGIIVPHIHTVGIFWMFALTW